MEKIVIARAGQPNVKKSSLVNTILNPKLRVGNFSKVIEILFLQVNIMFILLKNSLHIIEAAQEKEKSIRKQHPDED